MNIQRKTEFPLIVIFLIFSMLFLAGGAFFTKWGIDRKVLLMANTIFFILNIFTFFLHKKALQNKNPNVFVRSVMGGMMIKMLICIVAVVAYVMLHQDNFNKRALFAAMILYVIYLVVEVGVLTKLNKLNNA